MVDTVPGEEGYGDWLVGVGGKVFEDGDGG